MTVIYASRTVDSPAWDAGAILIESLAGDGAFVFTVGQSIGIVCGLAATDSDAFYGGISHAFWIETGRCKVMESGSSKTGFFVTNPATIYKIERVASTVRYYTDGVLRYTSLVASTGTVLLDCSLFAYGDTITTVERILYDGNVDGGTSDLVFPPLTGFGLESSALSYGNLSFQALIGTGKSLEAQSSLTFPALTGFGIEAGTRGYGSLQFPALQGQGEVTEGTLRFVALRGTGFETDGIGEGWLPALRGSGSTPIGEGVGALMPLVGWGIVADGEAAVALGAFTGFGVEDEVFYGTGTLSALTGSGFEIYDRPDFNQGWFFLRTLRGYGTDYPELDGDGAVEIPLRGQGTDTDLVGGLTFPALQMFGALQYGAYFNIPIQLNLLSISYNSTFDRLIGSDALTGGIIAATVSDGVTVTTTLTGALTSRAAVPSDTEYATDALGSGFAVTVADNVAFTDAFGATEWTAVAEAFVGEEDGGVATDVLASALTSTSATVETGVLHEQESADFSVTVTDSGVVQETLLGPLSLWGVTTDGLVLSEARNQDWTISGVSDQADATDAINAAYEVTEASTVAATDLLVLQLDLVGSTTDTSVVTVVLGYSAQETGPCDEALTISEVLALPIHQHAPTLADAPTAADTLVLLATEHVSKTDTATVAEALASVAAYYAPLTDTATATGTLSSAAGLSAALADTGLVADLLLESTQTLYVVNADTGAVSTYAVAPVVAGLAQYHDVLYVAGPEGLYALDATTDAGTAITWTAQTGFSNWGTDLLKRVLDVNLQARIQADTNLVLVTDRHGQKQSYRYRLPPLTRDSYRDGVTKLGKGIQSVYGQLQIQGQGEAELDQIRVRLEPLSRRR